MKVYFDTDGRLRHYGCDLTVDATVELWLSGCPIMNDDETSDFGEFSANIVWNLDDGAELCFVHSVVCECGESTEGHGLHLELVEKKGETGCSGAVTVPEEKEEGSEERRQRDRLPRDRRRAG